MKPITAHHRRYLIRMAVLMDCYILFLFLALRLVPTHRVTGALAWVLGALPGVAVAGIFWALGRLMIEETDEYLRMLIVRQTLWASGFALSIATLWGFLESFEIVGHVESYYVAVLWFGGLGLGSAMNRLTLGKVGA